MIWNSSIHKNMGVQECTFSFCTLASCSAGGQLLSLLARFPLHAYPGASVPAVWVLRACSQEDVSSELTRWAWLDDSSSPLARAVHEHLLACVLPHREHPCALARATGTGPAPGYLVHREAVVGPRNIVKRPTCKSSGNLLC